jgi:DNA-binding MarR family transcriptional regulator
MSARRRRNSALEVIEKMRKRDPGITLTHVLTFLYICENEGLNVAELATVCRTTRATASRTARALAPRSMPGSLAPHAGLIEQRPNPINAHGRLLFLTEDGRRLRDSLDVILAEGRSIAPTDMSNALEQTQHGALTRV